MCRLLGCATKAKAGLLGLAQRESDPKVIQESSAVWCGVHRPGQRNGRVASNLRPIGMLATKARPSLEKYHCLSEMPLPQHHYAQELSTRPTVRLWQRVRAASLGPSDRLPNELQRQPRQEPLRALRAWLDWVEENRSLLANMSPES